MSTKYVAGLVRVNTTVRSSLAVTPGSGVSWMYVAIAVAS